MTTLVVALAGCTQSDPPLLRESDFDGVVSATHDEPGQDYVPGPTWCRRLVPSRVPLPPGPISRLTFDEEDPYPTVGAMVVGRSLDTVTDSLEGAAAWCTQVEGEGPDRSLEPLTGLDDGAIGWRTRDDNGVWGEYVAVPLDGLHLLLVGFETDEAEPPIELDELIRLAREGVERVGLDD